MRQPRVFNREQVIEIAFNLIRKNGWSSVSARSIAKELGSSTMPIYSHMKSLEELEQELKVKSRACIIEYQSRTYSGEQLLDIAVGYVVFARDEKQLFRFLFMDRPDVTQSEDVQSQQEQFYSQYWKREYKKQRTTAGEAFYLLGMSKEAANHE